MRADRIPTIRSRLILLVVACILPAALMVAGLITHDYYRGRQELTRVSLGTARAIVSALDRDLAGVQAALIALSTSPSLTSDDLFSFYDQAQDVLKSQKANNILLFDQTFQQRLNTLRPFASKLPFITNPELQGVFKTGQPVTTSLYAGNVAKQPIIAVAVPVQRGGTAIYVLAAAILPERLSALLKQQRLGEGWISVILDKSGTIVARSHQMEQFVGTKGAPSMIARMVDVAEGSLETMSVEGIPILATFSRSAVSNWTVAIGIPTSILTNELLSTLAWLVAGMTILLLGSLAFAWSIGSKIARPIHQLAAPALALGSGVAVAVPPLHLREADEVGRALTRASAMLMASQHRANHDVLTGLANRALFEEILVHQLAICRRTSAKLAIAYIDLDGFKPVNDLHGHATGDEVLRMVAARLTAAIRESDVAARLGGDEFALILLHTGAADAETVARKLIAGISAPYVIDSLTLHVSASIGIAVYPESGTTSEALSQRADEAMYEAKAAGRQRFAIAS